MIVKELKELLKEFNDNDIVIMSKDSEGNRYSPLSDIAEASYEAETAWYGEVGLRKLTEEDIKEGYTEEDVLENGVDAIILYPIN